MIRIAKTFDFDAAHHLPHVPDGHKCKRLHGHTYRVEVMCEGEIDARGMVIDYAEIAKAWAPVDRLLDHRYLNEIPGLENPTTEVLAPFILRILAGHPVVGPVLSAVRVYESSTTYCEATR